MLCPEAYVLISSTKLYYIYTPKKSKTANGMFQFTECRKRSGIRKTWPLFKNILRFINHGGTKTTEIHREKSDVG